MLRFNGRGNRALRTVLLGTILALLIACTATSTLFAAGWEWPSQMNIGGFSVTDVRGSVNGDGSGSATGTLQIPGFGNSRVSLNRSSRGEVAGSAPLNVRSSDVDLRGDFSLSNSGLRGRGTLNCASRTIDDASISISSHGQATGSGRIQLGHLALNVDFNLSSSSCSITGSASVRSQADTPLATYKFDGRLNAQSSGGRLSVLAAGKVERTGKLANQVTTSNISNAPVDSSNGQCTVNVGGVSVTFTMF